MKIRKFNEKYEMDLGDDISKEYAKLILSNYLDQENEGNVTLEDVYVEIVKEFVDYSDDYDFREDAIRSDIINIINELKHNAKKIRTVREVDVKKYNL